MAGNLSIVTALAGESTVVVDCDLRRPSVASQLGVNSKPGLTDVLIGRTDLDSALTGGRRLSVLSPGALPPNPTELLGSQAMVDLMEQLHGRFERVIVDSPPCLPCADASVLAPLCGATLLVVHMGSTTYDQLERTVSTLAAARARICGVTANMMSTKRFGAYEDYYDYNRDDENSAPDDLMLDSFGSVAPRGNLGLPGRETDP